MNTLDSTTQALFQDARKRRAWVIYQLSVAGRSLADVARAAGVRRQTLYRGFDVPYPRMERLIADAVGVRPQELFPERYDADGLPNRAMGRPKKTVSMTVQDNSRAARRNVKAVLANRQTRAA